MKGKGAGAEARQEQEAGAETKEAKTVLSNRLYKPIVYAPETYQYRTGYESVSLEIILINLV